MSLKQMPNGVLIFSFDQNKYCILYSHLDSDLKPFLWPKFTFSFVTVYTMLHLGRRKTSLVSMNSDIMNPLRDHFVCQMFCSPQWQPWCCTWRSLGQVPARCLGPCVWCCCWALCTARLCRLSPAGGPRAVQLPAAPPALRAEGGGFLIVRHCTLICLY